jgi:hypothetical protein
MRRTKEWWARLSWQERYCLWMMERAERDGQQGCDYCGVGTDMMDVWIDRFCRGCDEALRALIAKANGK